MFSSLNFQQFTQFAKSGHAVAVYKEIPGDKLTPVTAYQALKNDQTTITLLESSPKLKVPSRYSHLCFQPIAEIQTTNNQVMVIENQQQTILDLNP